MKHPPCLNRYRAIIFRSGLHQEYYFRLVAKNGRIIAQSEGYHRKADCIKTASLIMDGSPEPIREEGL